MTRGIRVRIAAFLVLSAVGIVYIAASYLGFVDKVLGRGITVHATLPVSGGLFEGSEVTYRGVKVGKVSDMKATRDGVILDLALEEGTKIPLDSPVFVHNLSAVGEQYIDFEPADDSGPYAREGDTIKGSEASMPVAEEDLLIELDALVQSVDKKNLGVVIGELGDLFYDTGGSLQKLIDNGILFVDTASANKDATVALLDNGLKVLKTQQEQGENIRAFSKNLGLLTDALAASDPNLRTVLKDLPPTVREVGSLLTRLEPTLPVLFANLVTVNQVMVNQLAGLEQLLVEFPSAVASGFTGTPGDGWGHVNLQMAQNPGPCKGAGYKPVEEWRRGDQLDDAPIYPARCLAGPPFNQRGSKYSPGPVLGGNSSARDYDGTNPAASSGEPMNLSVMGGDAWKWLLAGPVSGQ